MLLKDHGASNPPKGTRYENMHVGHVFQMCLFTTAISFPSAESSGHIIVTFTSPHDRSTKTWKVPLQPDTSGLEMLDVNMHQSPTKSFHMGSTHSEWFSSCFDYPVVLTYLGTNYRPVLGNIAPNAASRNVQRQQQPQHSNGATSWLSSIASSMPSILGGGSSNIDDEDYNVTFADCSPYLIISSTSHSNVSGRLPEGQDMDITKFRPNIIVSGAADAFDEDYWSELSINSSSGASPTKIQLTSNCIRCASINVDYDTGTAGTGPAGEVLKKLQADRRVDKGHKYGPVFGRYGFLSREEIAYDGTSKTVKVGDEVEVTKRNQERTVFRWPGLGQTPKTELYPV